MGNKALWGQTHEADAEGKPLDWRHKMSDNVAYALLVYTGLQIWLTTLLHETGRGSILPYFALIILVALIIPACRQFEKRWECLNDEQAGDVGFSAAFRRDRGMLWLLAIGLPFVLTGVFRGIAALI